MKGDARVVVLIPARLDSSRLPVKQLRTVRGKALLWYLVERMSGVPEVDEVVIATTDRPTDDPLVDWAENRGIGAFRGAHEDLLKRLKTAASALNADVVVRANGDNPLLAPEVTENGLAALLKKGLEFTTGKGDYTDLPVGLGPELLEVSTLPKLMSATTNRIHRQHVTSYIFDHPDEFRWEPIPVDPEWAAPELSVTVDTNADLHHVAGVIDALPDRHPSTWSVEEIIAACRSIDKDERNRN